MQLGWLYSPSSTCSRTHNVCNSMLRWIVRRKYIFPVTWQLKASKDLLISKVLDIQNLRFAASFIQTNPLSGAQKKVFDCILLTLFTKEQNLEHGPNNFLLCSLTVGDIVKALLLVTSQCTADKRGLCLYHVSVCGFVSTSLSLCDLMWVCTPGQTREHKH